MDWLLEFYCINKVRVNLSNYKKIALIGENFCKRKDNPLYGKNLRIYNNGARENLKIGNNVVLDCKINCNAMGKLTIGDFTSIRENTTINCNREIYIGSHCFIGDRVLVQDNDSHPESPEMRRKQSLGLSNGITDTYDSQSAPVVIKSGVWIGTGAMVLKGVTIGENSIIGAGSVVTGNISSGHIAAGNPARIIRKVSQ